ncbi:actin-related protein 5 [Eurytemora carolleeae]|uniref:actin-related protein 5 n=1 Tax=Eurytemora carolleeae TaxID=1294199 RepID=UPI000C7753D0|nr:actin-related protein 5 [Eurytemora carolleeae]|eukprot:XP_023329463.1 actin-related protein 5-like [Eurytemora affinis]
MILDDDNIYRFPDPSPLNSSILDYSEYRGEGIPLVVDYGSSMCRMGWAGEENPKICYRNIYAKCRKDSVLQIGNSIGNIEAVRPTIKSPFDRNLVTHLEGFELLFDYGISRLGVDTDGSVDHPVCITECPANTNFTRHGMNEVLFELYNVPSVGYGIDSLFSLQHNCTSVQDALVISLGHQTIHVIPVLGGVPHLHNARSNKLGGLQLQSYMQRILQLRYQNHSATLTLSRIEDMFSLLRVSSDFHSDLKLWKDPDYYESNALKVQLPFVATVKAPPVDPEILKARRQELGRRLMEINSKKRESKLQENIKILEQLDHVKQIVDQGSETRTQRALLNLNLTSTEELISLITRTKMAIDKANEAKLREAQREETAAEPETKKRREDMCESERIEFDSWISDVRSKLQEIREKKAVRARRRKQIAKRRTAASQERMRIISHLARNNKEEDNFGLNDSDWDVYKQISRDAEDSDSEEENLKAQEYESVLKEHGDEEEEINRNSPLWHQVHLSTEITMIPEIIFQPSILGLEQAGLGETIQFIFTKYSCPDVARLSNNVLLTGGLSKIPGLQSRLEVELQQMLPFKSTFQVSIVSDPELVAWRGASEWAAHTQNQRYRTGFMTRAEYEEHGEGYLKEHMASNKYTPTPPPPEVLNPTPPTSSS